MKIRKDEVDLATELSHDLLPDIIVEIANLVGMSKTMQLVQAFGGTNLPMPIGVENSMSEQALINWRDNRLIGEIKQAVMNGMSQTRAIRQYAVKYGISERWVYELLKTHIAQQQPRLF